MKKIIKYILTIISPKLEATLNYRWTCGEWLNWKEPQDINAKLQWLKVNTYYKNEEVTNCIDKFEIRNWLKTHDFGWLCPQLYGVYNNALEIDWEKLPEQCAIKCNHSCGANIIISNKANIDKKDAIRKLNRWLKEDYWKTGEVQYRFIKKKIIIEEYLGAGDDLKTFKFFCFNGNPKVLYISMEEDKYINYYDMDFNMLPYRLSGHANYPYPISRPENFDELVRIAREISSFFPFVRVDLYDSYGTIYISELTFIPTAGFMQIDPPSVLKEWGEWLNIKDY